jgi:hypothetical protein
MYWIYNFHIAQIKHEFFKEKETWETENLERLKIDKYFIVVKDLINKNENTVTETEDSKLLKTFVHTRDFKLMALVDQNEGKEKERASILALKNPNSNVSIILHCFFFNFLPFSLRAGDDFKRHLGIEFEFYMKDEDVNDPLILYNIIIFLTTMKLNWIWVEEEIIERFEKSINETPTNKRSI